MNKTVHIVIIAYALCFSQGMAGISFGSRESAIELGAGSFDFTADSIALTKGTLHKNGAGDFTGDSGEYLNCTKMTVNTSQTSTQKGMYLSGDLYLDDATMTLANNDILVVSGGQVAETITVNGADATPSILQGNGSFAAGISVNSTRELIMRWDNEMAQDLTLTSSSAGTTKLTLERDLRFANGYSVEASSETGTAQVDFNGYAMTVGGVTIGAMDQSWVDARLELNGNTTISADVTLSGNAAVFNCHGHKLSITGATAGSVGGTITNATLDGYDSGVLACTGTWTLLNTVLDDGSQKMRVVSGQLTGGTADVFAAATTWPTTSIIELLTDFDLPAKWTLTEACTIIGNGKTINFSDENSIIDYNGALTLSDMKLTNIVKESFDNNGDLDLYLDNVEWHDDVANGGGSIRISASPLVDSPQSAQLSLPDGGNGEDGLLFDNTTDDTNCILWDNGAQIDLLSNVDLNTTWTFDDTTVINGNGYVMNLVGGQLDYNEDLYLSNIILAEVDAAAFDNEQGKDLYLSDVVWLDGGSNEALHIIGNTETSPFGPAQVSLATSETAGDLFATAVTWNSGVNMELLKGITFASGAAWTFSENTIMKGNGHVIDLNSISAPMTIAAGKTLSISDAVITGWGNSEIVLGAAATLELSNVTIVMDANYSTTLTGETIRINGGCTIITGEFEFDASTGTNEINGVTLWFDTLGRQDYSQVKMGSFSGGGKVMMQPLNPGTDVTFSSTEFYLTSSMLLDYDVINGSETYFGRVLTIDNSTGFTMQGGGRSLYMNNEPGTGASSTKLITVTGSASNKVEFEDVTISGWNPTHITDTNSLIRYGNGSIIRLKEDLALASVIYVSNASSGDTVTIDLNGHELDMDSDSSAFDIAATDVNLIIKNGRIMNLNDNSSTTKFLLNSGTSSTVTFQNVDIVLNGATRLLNNNVTFKGKCKVSGTADATLSLLGTTVTIDAGAWLTIDKGMTLALDDMTSAASIAFSSANSTLELFGATLDVSGLGSAPTFTTGTFRIDDIATLNGSMTLGGSGTSDLDVDLQPAASLLVTSGTITYANAS